MTGSAIAADPATATVDAFNEAFGRGDVDGVMALMTDDCVFESTAPPTGRRYQGQEQVRAAWAEFFAGATDPLFETEEQFALADRVVVRWRFSWGGDESGEVRGVDLFTVRDGLVAEKLAYVKG
ncbi:nuclear transport factor 2 family protein [Gordonia sp. NPDC003424]